MAKQLEEEPILNPHHDTWADGELERFVRKVRKIKNCIVGILCIVAIGLCICPSWQCSPRKHLQKKLKWMSSVQTNTDNTNNDLRHNSNSNNYGTLQFEICPNDNYTFINDTVNQYEEHRVENITHITLEDIFLCRIDSYEMKDSQMFI